MLLSARQYLRICLNWITIVTKNIIAKSADLKDRFLLLREKITESTSRYWSNSEKFTKSNRLYSPCYKRGASFSRSNGSIDTSDVVEEDIEEYSDDEGEVFFRESSAARVRSPSILAIAKNNLYRR